MIIAEYSKEAAEKQAAYIEKMWHDKGAYSVKCWVETVPGKHGHVIHGVRSNLIRGLPPSPIEVSMKNLTGAK